MNNKSSLARIVAEKYHKGQMYGEVEYIYHCDCVANHFENNDVMKTIAYLHDTLEDTTLTYEELSCWFGGYVANTVRKLTRQKDEQYKKYIERIKYSGAASIFIKLADLEENMKNNANESLMKRYKWALEFLNS